MCTFKSPTEYVKCSVLTLVNEDTALQKLPLLLLLFYDHYRCIGQHKLAAEFAQHTFLNLLLFFLSNF